MRLLIIPRNNQFHSNLKYKKFPGLPSTLFSNKHQEILVFFFSRTYVFNSRPKSSILKPFPPSRSYIQAKNMRVRSRFFFSCLSCIFFPSLSTRLFASNHDLPFLNISFFSQYQFDLHVFKWLKLLCPVSKSDVFIDNCYISHLSLKPWVFMLI